MPDILSHIPQAFINLFLVVVYSLLIGIEQRRHHIDQPFGSLFGTDRTFTLIGILGFVLYVIDPVNFYAFIGGGALIGALLSISYYNKIKEHQLYGLTSIMIALLTYCFAPLIYTQAPWLVLLIVITILILTQIKSDLFIFTKKFREYEFVTLAMFLLLAGVILPILPDKQFSPDIHITPYKMWLAVVIVSGLSYLSYLLKKFIFPDSGTIVTGILGGLLSSTATTIILSRKSKDEPNKSSVVPAIILATSMMYVRIQMLAFFFNYNVAMSLLPWFLIFIAIGIATFLFLTKFRNQKINNLKQDTLIAENRNPLEFKTALFFASLFILFAVLTGYVFKEFGSLGINIFSFIVGITDIDPFILNLLQGNWNIDIGLITISILNAIISNNILKLGYAIFLADKSLRKDLVIGFSGFIVVGIAVSVYLFFYM